MDRTGKSREYLSQDHINTGHVLSLLCPEIVAKTASGTPMSIVIFDQVPDVFHAMLRAPLPDLTAETVLHQ